MIQHRVVYVRSLRSDFYKHILFGSSRAGLHAYKKENIKSDERSGYRTGKRTRVAMQFGCLF